MREANRAKRGQRRTSVGGWLTFDELFAHNVLQQLSEWLSQCEHLAEISQSEIGSGCGCVGTLSADLNYADHYAPGENRRTHDLLDCFAGRAGRGLHTLEHRSVTRVRKGVVDLRSALAGGACGQCRIACQRNEADVLQPFRRQEVQ